MSPPRCMLVRYRPTPLHAGPIPAHPAACWSDTGPPRCMLVRYRPTPLHAGPIPAHPAACWSDTGTVLPNA
ncbi:hypothetical protein VZT92_002047 [Zoarces viviparus]|uniref:Uncharacterized protein n=1 Tax=Zoarces viviparus TaxID=48416 RepID=A0AAW1G4E1_ZOAVI